MTIQKDLAREALHELFERSKTLDKLVEQVRVHEELEIYSYRSKVKGVIYKGRKFRFSTLQIDKSKILELKKIEKRLKELSLIRETFSGRSRGLER